MIQCRTYSANIPETLCAARYRKYRENDDEQFILCGQCEIGKTSADSSPPRKEEIKFNGKGKGKGWSNKVPFLKIKASKQKKVSECQRVKVSKTLIL